MDMEKLQTLLLQTAEVLEQFRRQSEQASQAHRQSAVHLQRLADTAPRILRDAADSSLSALSGQVRDDAGKGLDQAAETLQRRVLEAGNQISRNAHQSLQVAQQLQRVTHGLWVATVCSIALMLTALAGGAWLSKHYYDEVRSNQISAKLLKAYDAADVTLCGSRLCANVDDKAQRVGDKRQYKPVHERR